MACSQKWLYETSGKMFLFLALLFLVCSAYDSSSSSDEEDVLPDDIVDTKQFGGYSKRNSLLDEKEEEEMAKRALSLLAHWRPQFLGLPKVNTRSDIVSAVTRGGRPSRPLGQPLRWG